MTLTGKIHVVGYDDDPTTTITDAAPSQFLRLLVFLRLHPLKWEGMHPVERALAQATGSLGECGHP